MKTLVFGSLNIDHVYQVPHAVRPGETLAAAGYARFAGGKGLNQALALSRAGQDTFMAGAIGRDGLFLKATLEEAGVDTADLAVTDLPTGHAIIQVDEKGQNSIVILGGANQSITREQIIKTLSRYQKGDTLVLQNEISNLKDIITLGAERGLDIMLNPSPITEELKSLPLEKVTWLILNEIEGQYLAGEEEPEKICGVLLKQYPKISVILTLGDRGALYADAARRVYQAAFPVHAVDTTGAGDTFTGYFLSTCLDTGRVDAAMKHAAMAAAIAVSRPGAGPSIPFKAEVERALTADAEKRN